MWAVGEARKADEGVGSYSSRSETFVFLLSKYVFTGKYFSAALPSSPPDVVADVALRVTDGRGGARVGRARRTSRPSPANSPRAAIYFDPVFMVFWMPLRGMRTLFRV